MIRPEHIVAIDIEPAEVDNVQARRLADCTVSTGQPDRLPGDKSRDACIGKVAKLAWLHYLQRESIVCRLWDHIRRDGGRDPAPLDGFIAQPDAAELLASDVFADAACQCHEGVHFRPIFYPTCERRGIFGFEVKSTGVGPRHLVGGQVSYTAILEDDFLVYASMHADALDASPPHKLISQEQRLAAAERTPYVLVRAYVELRDSDIAQADSTAWMYRVYLVGYMTRPVFFGSSHLRLMVMPRPNKGERAVYYAVPLRLGFNLAGLRQALGL